MTLNVDWPEARLLRAMMEQTVRDAHSSNQLLSSAATEFLTSEEGRVIRVALYTDSEFVALVRMVSHDGRRKRWQARST